MGTQKQRAILVVSFGTSHADTCTKTIDAIENEIRKQYPQYPLYRAWTSNMIRQKIEKRDGVHIFSVKEALEQMKKDGVTEVAVQQTYILSGNENERMKNELKEAGDGLELVMVSTPLLTTQEDCAKTVELLSGEWKLSADENLVFMGHGSETQADFAAMNEQFRVQGHKNIMIAAMEGCPKMEDVIEMLKQSGAKRVVLAPFMIVAGAHANREMASEEEDSWKSILEKEGYEVHCVLKGLGEYEGIRKLFMKHLAETLAKM